MGRHSLDEAYLARWYGTTLGNIKDTVMKSALLVGLVLMALMVMLVHGHAFLLGQKVGMHARVIATSAIYQKVHRREGRWKGMW